MILTRNTMKPRILKHMANAIPAFFNTSMPSWALIPALDHTHTLRARNNYNSSNNNHYPIVPHTPAQLQIRVDYYSSIIATSRGTIANKGTALKCGVKTVVRCVWKPGGSLKWTICVQSIFYRMLECVGQPPQTQIVWCRLETTTGWASKK